MDYTWRNSMKKRILISSTLFLFFSLCLFAKDFELMFSTPSLTGLVCGKNTFLGQTQDYENISGGFNYSIQGFGEIVSVGKFTFAYSPAMNFYTQKFKNSNEKDFQLGLSLGAGVFFNNWESFTSQGKEILPLTGTCVFLYPLYELPVINIGEKPYWSYKYAFEAGFNYTFKKFSIYPYFRTIGMLQKKENIPGIAFDLGILIGIYF